MSNLIEEAKKSPNVDKKLLNESLSILQRVRELGLPKGTGYTLLSPRQAANAQRGAKRERVRPSVLRTSK